MIAKQHLTTRLMLLVVLALLAGSSYTGPVYANPGQQDSAPGSVLPQPNTAQDAAPQAEIQAVATPGVNYLTYHSLLFQPIRSATDWDYSFNYGTLHLLTATIWGEFAMPLSLPDKVDIREITFFFRDNNSVQDLVMGLCVVPIGGTAGGCLKWQVTSGGVNTTALVERTLVGNPIVTVDNANYSYFLVAIVPIADPQFGLVSGRVGFATSTFLPAIQR